MLFVHALAEEELELTELAVSADEGRDLSEQGARRLAAAALALEGVLPFLAANLEARVEQARARLVDAHDARRGVRRACWRRAR